MENQHQQITGYRDLTQTEIDLMNEIKAKGIEVEQLVEKVNMYLVDQRNAAKVSPDSTKETQRLDIAQSQRWAAIAKTDFQTALMALTRAVAQPVSF